MFKQQSASVQNTRNIMSPIALAKEKKKQRNCYFVLAKEKAAVNAKKKNE